MLVWAVLVQTKCLLISMDELWELTRRLLGTGTGYERFTVIGEKLLAQVILLIRITCVTWMWKTDVRSWIIGSMDARWLYLLLLPPAAFAERAQNSTGSACCWCSAQLSVNGSSRIVFCISTGPSTSQKVILFRSAETLIEGSIPV